MLWTLPMTSEGRIDMAEMEKAINERTKLVSISLVSTINGFQHDLKRVCDIAQRVARMCMRTSFMPPARCLLTCVRAASILRRALL